MVSIKEKDREHISKVMYYKDEGNKLFRAGATREAMKQYHSAMMYLKTFDDNMYISSLNCETQSTTLSNMPEEAKQQVVQLNVSIANNLAGERVVMHVRMCLFTTIHNEQTDKLLYNIFTYFHQYRIVCILCFLIHKKVCMCLTSITPMASCVHI